jgi:hypothetical protein
VRESRTLRLTWRGLETWPWWNCEPIPQSKERGWKPSTYSRRACPRPYLNGGDEETCRNATRLAPTQLPRARFQPQLTPSVGPLAIKALPHSR